LRGCGDERLLDGVLGSREIPVTPDDSPEHPRREFAQQALEVGRSH
jgi:hypothetical protein